MNKPTSATPALLIMSLLIALAACRPSGAGQRGDAGGENLRRQCFEAVWQTVNERYFDPNFGGEDWTEIRERYRPLVSAAASEEDFYRVLNRMVFELGVSHIGVVPPDEKEQLEPVAAAEGSAGVELRLIGSSAFITRVVPGGPGERAGLRPGYLVERLGGMSIPELAMTAERIPPLHERNERKRVTGKLLEQLYGQPGDLVSVGYRDAAGSAHEVHVTLESRPGRQKTGDGRIMPFYVEFESRRLGEFGYIRLNAFLPPVVERLAEAMRSLADARGLVIDLRGNHGGVFHVRKPFVDRLVPDRRLLWSFKGRRSTRKVFTEPAKDAYRGPLVVLVDVMSASSAEEVAGGLQSIGRATVVGERTAGIDLVMDAVTLPNGALFVFPVEQTRTADGTVLESRGVIPDVEVKLERAKLLAGIDSQLAAAVKLLEPGAKSIIARSADALGGLERIRSVRTLRLEVVYPDHGKDAVLLEIRLPNKLRTGRPGEYVAIFDGRCGAMLRYDPANPGAPPAPQDLPSEAARGFETDLVWFFPLFCFHPTEYAGLEDSTGTTCHKLVTSLPMGTRAEYRIDARTFLIRSVAVVETSQGRAFRMEREWLDLERVDGILFPRRMTYPGRGGRRATAEVRRIEVDPGVGEDRFRVPAAERSSRGPA